jgi:hypothetical protein
MLLSITPFRHSAIPPFRHSAIPPFRHSAIPPFYYHSAIPPFRHSAILLPFPHYLATTSYFLTTPITHRQQTHKLLKTEQWNWDRVLAG